MRKGIYLQATVAPKDPQADPVDEAALRQALKGTHDGLTIEIKRMRPTDGAKQVILYLRGEQEPAADFAQWTTRVVRDLWDRTLGARWQLQELVERDDYVTEEEDDAEDQEPAAPPAAPASAPAAAAPQPAAPAATPQPPATTPPPARARSRAGKLRAKKKHWPWRRRQPGK